MHSEFFESNKSSNVTSRNLEVRQNLTPFSGVGNAIENDPNEVET